MPLTTTLAGGSALIKWLLRDEFTDTRAAGAVNGTPATPGPGTRAVVDGGTNLSIGSGVLTNNWRAAWGDKLTYGSQAMSAGLMFIVSMTANAGNTTQAGWWNAGITKVLAFQFSGTEVRLVQTGFSSLPVGTISVITEYQLVVLARVPGAYLFIHGGAFANWTLLGSSSIAVDASMLPTLRGNNVQGTTSYVRVPDALYLPAPLAYDSFTRANGALGSSEATGPDGQTAPVKVWQSGSATWTIAGNEAVNTPTEGGELVTNGSMEADANWADKGTPTTNERSAAQAHGGTFSRHVVADAAAEGIRGDTFSTTTAVWYAGIYWAYPTVLNLARYQVRQGDNAAYSAGVISTPATLNTWNQVVFTYREAGGGAGAWFDLLTNNTGDCYFDDASIKPLTLNTLFSNVETGTADVVCQVELDTVVTGTQAGLVLNLDDKDTPANFVIAYHDGTNCKLEKCVAGTYTTVITAATAYAAGATLVVIKEGTAYSLYYNNAKVGATSTISDAGIIDNTLHGMFSTYSGNQLDNFLVMPRGTGGEYSGLDRYAS